MENILMKMARIKDLSPSERHVVDYILANYRDVCNMGIVELGEKTFTSTTTVKRLCRKLGVESYTSFRMLLSAAQDGYAYREDAQSGEQAPLGQFDSAGEVLEKVSRQNAVSILETGKLIDPQVLEQVITLMARAGRIDFYGIGPSHVVALDAQMKCMRLKIPSTAYNDRLSMLTGAGAYTEGALAFLISHTGETDDIVELARALCRHKVPTVAITSVGSSTLSELCLYCLQVDSGKGMDGLNGMSSRIAALNMIDVLFTALRNTNYERYSYYISQTTVNNREAP